MSEEKENQSDDRNEVIDIEEFARSGRQPPKGRRYRFRVDRETFITEKEQLTGREILELAGKNPPENWILSQLKRKAVVSVGLTEMVDLTDAGIERFMTLPKDQTEGEPRRAFELSQTDAEGLTALGLFWETVQEAGANWLLAHNLQIPGGFTTESVTAAIQVPASYPKGALDMVYFYPPVERADGKPIPQTQSPLDLDGKRFQRWSRHYTSQNPWDPEKHSILTHLVLARYWVERELGRAA